MDSLLAHVDMSSCTVWFEAADGYSVKPPVPAKTYKPHLFARAPEQPLHQQQ